MATLNLHNVGDEITITGILTEADGTPVDPDGLVVVVQAPNGTQTKYTLNGVNPPVRVAAGEYTATIVPDAPGEWLYQFRSSGTGRAMDEGAFMVEQPRIVVQGA